MKKHTIAIVLAAGQGKRMNSSVPKQYLLIKDKPILYYTLKTFEESFIDEIVLVVGEGEEVFCRENFVEKYNFTKISQIVVGGKERYHSVYNALKTTQEKDSIVFIHDGARPFVTNDILQRAYDAAGEYGACIVGVPVKDTIKIVGGNGFVQDTPDRNTLWSVQTPQTFLYEQIKNAYDTMMELEQKGELKLSVTDDSMVMENFGTGKVVVVKGSYENIKITTPEDLLIAERLLNEV